jgi:hypothetical protein
MNHLIDFDAMPWTSRERRPFQSDVSGASSSGLLNFHTDLSARLVCKGHAGVDATENFPSTIQEQ